VTTKGTGGGGGGTPVGSSTVHTEKQQLRNTGRLGRVSWHELIRD
jgi:hypothetical protein